MTTVLSVGNSEGQRRCDARCHRAKEPGCDCICESRYHGRGSARAIAEVQQDVAAGVFGEVATVDRPAQLRHLKTKWPEIVRFHRREVLKASRRLDQIAIEEKPRPARISGEERTAHG